MKRPVSLKDLAQELGVSVSTVSRALKNSAEVSDAMKEKVKKLAKERKYRPNPFAVSLLKNSPRIIGIIVPDIATYYYSSIISAINQVAIGEGYSTIIASSDETYEVEKQCVENLINFRVEGILACVSQQTSDFSHFDLLSDQNIPLVFFDRVGLSEKNSCVITDNVESAQKATTHLLENGSKRIGFIGGANHLNIVKLRKHGYLQALRDYKMPIDKDLVVCKEIGYELGYEAASQLLSQPNPADAFLCLSESLAFGALKAIRDKGLHIPNDIALIGYIDEIHANYVLPPLSAMTHQTSKMGETAFNLLLKQINGSSKIEKKVVPCVLTVRGSTVKG
ncbi:MAG: cytR [Bacteroidetes bacterium]|nr:cytR [Bacteroidota bacterium]